MIKRNGLDKQSAEEEDSEDDDEEDEVNICKTKIYSNGSLDVFTLFTG